MIVAHTGHRPDKLGGYEPCPLHNYIKRRIVQIWDHLNPKLVMTGMALGVDTWVAELAIEHGIPFVAAVPFEGQERLWPEPSQKHYHELLQKAARIVVVSEGGYSARKMHIRNAYMVDHCDTLIGVWNHSEGGTGNCVTYALRKDKGLWLIDPRDFDPNSDSGTDQRS